MGEWEEQEGGAGVRALRSCRAWAVVLLLCLPRFCFDGEDESKPAEEASRYTGSVHAGAVVASSSGFSPRRSCCCSFVSRQPAA